MSNKSARPVRNITMGNYEKTIKPYLTFKPFDLKLHFLNKFLLILIRFIVSVPRKTNLFNLN